MSHLEATSGSVLLDIGCGLGRLPTGLIADEAPFGKYLGVDIDGKAVGWCQRYLASRDPRLSFILLDVGNPRYNPHGAKLSPGFRLPIADAAIDIIYLYSVFSHMTPEDLTVYLGEFQRILAPAGRVFFTAFVEDEVPDVTVNPGGYARGRWLGPLHCVRYSRRYFEGLLSTYGFRIEHVEHGAETDGQSAFYLRRAASADLGLMAGKSDPDLLDRVVYK